MSKLVIGKEAYDKIMYFIHKAKHEISGFGDVEVIKGVPTVTDIILIEQTNDSTETEMEAAAISKALYHHTVSETMKGELKFWWHSHVDMDVFWSDQDMKTINQLTQNGWWIHGVFNKKNQHKFAYSNLDPVNTFIDDLDLEIDNSMVYDINLANNDSHIDLLYEQIEALEERKQEYLGDLCDQDYDDLVTIKTYTPYYAGNYGYGNYTNPTYDWIQDETTGKWSKVEKDTNMGKSQEIPSTLTNFTQEFCDQIYSQKGAASLFEYGYTEDEILLLQNEFWVNDVEDLIDNELEFGPIAPRLLNAVIEDQNWQNRHA